jgi:hypothetical protein
VDVCFSQAVCCLRREQALYTSATSVLCTWTSHFCE